MMKTVFVRRRGAWIVVVGILLVGTGLWLAPQGISIHKGAGGSGAHQGTAVEQKKTAVRGDQTQSTKTAKQNEFFVQYRLERDRIRSQQIDLFREIVNNQNSPEETRKEAQRRLLTITQAMDTEMKLENLIKAENFKDAVVFMQDKSVTVIVETPVLTPLDKDRLTGITVRATGFTKDNVEIIAKV